MQTKVEGGTIERKSLPMERWVAWTTAARYALESGDPSKVDEGVAVFATEGAARHWLAMDYEILESRARR